ncbi:MAG TPA: Ku protein [Thermoleophilia bacterium]|nr:Ku protein [Thermoleophilia bacterium]
MPRPVWKGAISFGLVNVPVALYAAESRDTLRFRQLDRTTLTPVREHRINEQTGQEVEWADIVKGYEYSPDRFVVLSDEELDAVDRRAAHTIDIQAFVDSAEIDPCYYDRPYYIAPTPGGEKGYALFRETLRRSGRVAVAKVVIRTKEYLAGVMPAGSVLLLELLRYPHELHDTADLGLPGEDLAELGVKDREVALAEQLVAAMVEPWNPEQYRDEHRDAVLKLVQRKIEAGREYEALATPAASAPEGSAEVIDIMSLLKASVERRQEQAGEPDGAASASPAAR